MSNNSILENAPLANAQTVQQPDTDTDPLFGIISRHKFAVFSECEIDDDGVTIIPVEGTPIIRILLTEGDLTIESQWQTPFDNSNPEHKLPTLMASLQSGQLLSALGQVASGNGAVGSAISAAVDVLDPVTSVFKNALESVKGKTNLTKANTTQVFSSTSSVRLNLTLSIVALRDARIEVEQKIMQLQAWSVPKFLYQYGVAVSVGENGLGGLFPSVIPPYIQLTTHGKTYSPFVIESVSAPIVTPIDKDGNRLNLSVNMSMLSKAAWDAIDVRKLYGA